MLLIDHELARAKTKIHKSLAAQSNYRNEYGKRSSLLSAFIQSQHRLLACLKTGDLFDTETYVADICVC